MRSPGAGASPVRGLARALLWLTGHEAPPAARRRRRARPRPHEDVPRATRVRRGLRRMDRAGPAAALVRVLRSRGHRPPAQRGGRGGRTGRGRGHPPALSGHPHRPARSRGLGQRGGGGAPPRRRRGDAGAADAARPGGRHSRPAALVTTPRAGAPPTDALPVVFQPIFEIGLAGHRIHGVEGLVRGALQARLDSAAALLAPARVDGEEAAIDRACVAAVMREARALPADMPLTVNVRAATLAADVEFVAFLTDRALEASIARERLVVDGVDDVGLGTSNYRMMLECRPAYFKVDAYFVLGAARDPHRLLVLESIAGLARKFGGRAVAEGVESAADLAAVVGAGFD